jgi:hypothetical protein
MCFGLVQDLRLVRHQCEPQRCLRARWGREHLVDLERSEQIYLVICDHTNSKPLNPFLLYYPYGKS